MRAILSDEVRKSIMSKCSSSEEYMKLVNNPEYAGKVSGIEKVTLLKNSVAGIQFKPTHKRLMDKFQMFQAVQPEHCTLDIELLTTGEVRHIPVSGDQLAMLKALAYEQCNLCLEYSKVVATLFWDYVRALINGGSAEYITYTDAKGSWGALVKRDIIEFMKVKGV